jgi:hypothetical protein
MAGDGLAQVPERGGLRMTWIAVLVEILTKGWPAAVVVLAWILRHPLKGLIDRIERAEFPDLSIPREDTSEQRSGPEPNGHESEVDPNRVS